jgi:hypothetical protein
MKQENSDAIPKMFRKRELIDSVREKIEHAINLYEQDLITEKGFISGVTNVVDQKYYE